MVFDIDIASKEQQSKIQNVHSEIKYITETASHNAITSEKSVAASHSMHENAETLKKAMSKFNLRKRQEGQAYIPPEKINDTEFIKKANENYKKSLELGIYDNI